MEIPRTKGAGFDPAEFCQARQQDGADRHIDPDAESIGAADDLEQPALGQLLHQHAVTRQQSGMVQSDAVPQTAFHFLAVGTVERHVHDRFGDRRFLRGGAVVDAQQRLRGLGHVVLREVHDVNRRLFRLHQVLHHGIQTFIIDITELQRHGSDRG